MIASIIFSKHINKRVSTKQYHDSTLDKQSRVLLTLPHVWKELISLKERSFEYITWSKVKLFS